MSSKYCYFHSGLEFRSDVPYRVTSLPRGCSFSINFHEAEKGESFYNFSFGIKDPSPDKEQNVVLDWLEYGMVECRATFYPAFDEAGNFSHMEGRVTRTMAISKGYEQELAIYHYGPKHLRPEKVFGTSTTHESVDFPF